MLVSFVIIAVVMVVYVVLVVLLLLEEDAIVTLYELSVNNCNSKL